MNKKRIIVIVLIIILLSLFGIIIYSNLVDYSNVLKLNWNISLPKNVKEIYSVNDNTSFHGDGIRYHVFSYKNEDEIKKLFNWSSKENITIYYSSFSESVDNWLKKIKVSKNMYPNYSNCKYWYNKKNDNSEIIILWDDLENRLYIVESFL